MIRRVGVLRGVVQGVGLRPAVARLARAHGLVGFVRNEGGSVRVEVQGPEATVDVFVTALTGALPAAARVDAARWSDAAAGEDAAFLIAESAPGAARPAIPADLATCAACLAEVRDPADRRYAYPFTNCTACGPRFTIVAALPYDRARTSMAPFAPCPDCAREYADDTDRRYHAEPVACPACGPSLWLAGADGARTREGALQGAIAAVQGGLVLALKGLGGWQLVCDARDEAAVARLRARKRRPARPFAVMVRDLDAAREVAALTDGEARALAGPDAPIVLARSRGGLAPSVAPALRRVGLMLPTTPLHHALLAAIPAVVCTSGNVAEEPLAIGDDEALRDLAGVADRWLGHDRAILRRCDDAVVHVVDRRTRALRLGRGRAPTALPLADGPPLVAVGGHLQCAPAAATVDEAVLWPHVGDLEGPRARDALRAALDGLVAFLGIAPVAVVHDAHPDYGSTRVAEALGLPRVAVWHHHAHVAAVMAEHGLSDALGFAWDGVGLGPDGAAWGGEVLRVDPRGARRVAWLRPFPLPGGDRAARDGRRALAGVLVAAGLEVPAPLAPFAAVARGAPTTTSAGRLFDAVAALLGVCDASRYEGWAATRLEDRAGAASPLPYARDGAALDWRPAIRALAADPTDGASRFHATLVAMIRDVAVEERVPDVVLAGGCFQNRALAEGAAAALRGAGLRPWLAERAPPGDGGLALGQLQVARWARAGHN